MKRVAADQSIIDQAIALQAQGKTDREIAMELGVGPATPSNWRKQGRLPEKPQRKTNGGKVREYEPLPKLQPGQRLDGTPVIKQEAKKVIEVEKTKVEEKAAEVPVKPRITRSTTLRGEYVTLEVSQEGTYFELDICRSRLAIREALEALMNLEAEVHELIGEVEKLL